MPMRSAFRSFLVITALASASLACKAATKLLLAETPTPYVPEATATQELRPETETGLPGCPLVTDRILKAATQYPEKDPIGEDSDEPEQVYLVTYTVSGDRISAPFYDQVPADLASYQEDIIGHKQIWDTYTALIPPEQRGSLVEYSIVTDGEGNFLAAVEQTDYDPTLWELEVDIRDAGDKLNLAYTLIHEFAHLLTLGPEQVTPSQAIFDHPDDEGIFLKEASSCPDYFPGEGCSRTDSYINAFYAKFWIDIHPEWQLINQIEDDEAYYQALDDFYYKYEDQFVTDYAVTNPEEDIAEDFTFFVLSPRPGGDTIAEEKILFFYGYTELVQLREEILGRVCQLKP